MPCGFHYSNVPYREGSSHGGKRNRKARKMQRQARKSGRR